MIAQIPTQLSLPLDMSVIEQHRTLKECIAARVYAQRGGVTAVAGRLDMSPSHLSEILSGGGERNRKFDVEDMVRFMRESGDLTPLHWLQRHLPRIRGRAARTRDGAASRVRQDRAGADGCGWSRKGSSVNPARTSPNFRTVSGRVCTGTDQ